MNQAALTHTGSDQLLFAGTSRFQVLALLGQGSSGAVYEVYDRERDARFALKILRAPTAEAILLLKNEFRAVQDLCHPNLVQLHELFEENGQWFFTMEFVRGDDFLSHLREAPATSAGISVQVSETTHSSSEGRLRAILGQLAHGLCALHQAQKVHRDIKPSNVLVTSEGRVVILDFGIVSDLGRAGARDDGMVGTVLYMAPEQALGEAIGPAADWYAFGVMLYQALTGRLPFMGLANDVIERKVSIAPPAPREVATGVPADLDALCVALLRIDPAARPSGPEVLERLAASMEVQVAAPITQMSIFVGRHEELRALEQAYADVRTGAGVTMLIHGESGVGKSFLVRQITERLSADPTVKVYRGRCYERESVPYKAVDGVVDDLCLFLNELPTDEVIALLPPNAGLLCRVFPVLAQVPAISQARNAAEDVHNPKELRLRVFTALRGLLGNMARRWPIVLIVDDLQWADGDSVALLAQLTRPPAAPPLLLLCTQRVATETRERMRAGKLEATGLEGDVRNVFLDPLHPADAHSLVVQLMGGAESEAEVHAIAAEAKGHPLFIDELIRRRGTRANDNTPLRLDEVVWQRVARLEPAARKLLELVATAGMPLRQAITADAAAMDFGHQVSLVSTLRAANFVRTTGMHREDTIEPYHDRVRESVLAHLAPEERAAWHGRLAHALDRAGDADPETLATHWLGAGDAVRAADYALRGADNAVAALAFDHAAQLYRFALEQQSLGLDVARAVRLRLAEALVNAGRGAEAARIYLDLAGADKSPATLDLRRRAAEEYLCSGHFAEGDAVIREVLASFGESYPKSQGSALASVLYNRLFLRVRGLGFESRSASSIEPRTLQRIDALHSAGSGFAMIEPVRGTGFHARHLLAALRAGEPFRVARALSMFSIGTGSGGGPARLQTARQLAAIRALTKTIDHNPFLEGLATAVGAFAHYFVGEWEKAAEELLKAEETLRDECIGASYELNATRLVLCRTQAFRGDFADLAQRAPAYLREADQKGDLYASVGMRSNPAYLLALVSGDLERAERELAMAEQHLPTTGFQLQHLYCLTGRVQLDLYRGDGAAAHQHWVETWPKAKRGLLFVVQVTHISALDQRARATLALAAMKGTPDLSLLRQVEADIGALDATKMPWSAALASLLRAGAAFARGDKGRALAAGISAAEAFESLGMRVHAAAARRRQGELLGGDEGHTLVANANAWMRAQGIRDADRFTAVYAPGFGR